MRKHVSQYIAGGGVLLGLMACSGDSLNVVNINNPDVARAYATPAGVEGVVAGLGVQLNNTQRATESVNTQARILAGENIASVANFGMAARSQIPRSVISNELGNDNQTGNLANFNQFSRVTRTASNAIAAVNRLATTGQTIGSPAQDARAKAFAFLILGQALGLPIPMAALAGMAVVVTSATVIIFGKAIWDPVALAGDIGGVATKLTDGREGVVKVAPPPEVRVLRYEHDLLTTEVQALRLGAVDFIAKPLVAEHVRSRVRARLRDDAQLRRLRAGPFGLGSRLLPQG